jgi:hypothetical protein
VDLRGAQINGRLQFTNADVGTVSMIGTHIEKQLQLQGNQSGDTDLTQCSIDVLEDGVDLRGAQINGRLQFTNVRWGALHEEYHIERELQLQGNRSGDTDLTRYSIDVIEDGEDGIEIWPKLGKLHLDGFTYRGFGASACWDADQRIAWIKRQDGFHSQPYEQLASVYRDAGRSSDARDVGIAREGCRNVTLGNWQRPWHGLWGLLTAYGYKPARALWIFAVALILSGLFFWWAGESEVMEPTDSDVIASATECTPEYQCYQPLIYAADVMVPIVNLGQRDAWIPDVARGGTAPRAPGGTWSVGDPWTSAIGGSLVRNVTVFLIVAGWALTAAFIAAISRTISRS